MKALARTNKLKRNLHVQYKYYVCPILLFVTAPHLTW